MDIDSFISGDFVAEAFVEIVNQGRHCTRVKASILQIQAAEPRWAEIECPVLLRIAFEIAMCEEGFCISCGQADSVVLAQGAIVVKALVHWRINSQIYNCICISAGIPKRLRCLREENAVCDESDGRSGKS